MNKKHTIDRGVRYGDGLGYFCIDNVDCLMAPAGSFVLGQIY